MKYTVRLIALQCIVSQEMDGDEIYLTLNNQQIWSVPVNYAMHEDPHGPRHIKQINFVDGLMLTQDGWQPLPDFEAADYVFAGQTGWSQFEVWDHDNFSSDDFFGRIRFSENEVGHGRITGVAAGDAAHYVLTYEVVGEG